MQTKETIKQKLDAQLMEWNTQIDQLVLKIERAGADLKLKYAREINEIRAKQRELIGKFKELEGASGDTWEQVRVTTDRTRDEHRAGVVQSISRSR